MAIPPTAVRFAQSLDPQEELDWLVSLEQLLQPGEDAASYSLDLLPEAVALGLTIMQGDGRDHHMIDNRTILFWAEIDEDYEADPAFNGGGITLPMEVTIVTNSYPPRKRNRTFLIPVVHQ